MASRIQALSYLGYRAVLAHPLRRLRQVGSGRERFLENYAPERLLPTMPDDRRTGEAASACIGCGLCEVACDLAAAPNGVRALGLHAAFRLYSKGTPELPWAREALAHCSGCGACDAACPTGVPIASLVRDLLERALRSAPAR